MLVKNLLGCASAVAISIASISGANAQIFDYDGETSNDLIVDDTGSVIYISTDSGNILRFDLATQTFLDPIMVGGQLGSLAIDPVSGDLFAGQMRLGPVSSSQRGVVNRIDLDSLAVSALNYTLAFGEIGSFDVAFASNGVGFVSTDYAGSGWTPFREVDGVAGNLTIRSDLFGGVRQNTFLTTDLSGRYILVNEPNSSAFPLHIYDSSTDSVIASTNNFRNRNLPYSANGLTDISGAAGLVAVPERGGVQLLDLSLNTVRSIAISDVSIAGLAFSPDGGTLYVLDRRAGTVNSYNTASGALVDSLLTRSEVFPYYGFYDRSQNLLTIDGAGENLFIDFGTGFELINFATYVPFCQFTSPGNGGSVLCTLEVSRSFVTNFDDLTVTVADTAAFTGFSAFRFGGDNITLINEGRIDGTVEFNGFPDSNDTLINRGELNGQVRMKWGDDTFINADGGVVTGRVGLGRGDDVVRLQAGSRVASSGEIRLGSGNDHLIIERGARLDGFVSASGRCFFCFPFSDVNTADIYANDIDLSRIDGFDVVNIDVSDEVVVRNRFFADELNLLGGTLRFEDFSNASLRKFTQATGTTISGSGFFRVAEGLTVNGAIAPDIEAPQVADVARDTDLSLTIQGDVTFASGSTFAVNAFQYEDSEVFNESLGVFGAIDIQPRARLRVGFHDNLAPVGEAEIEVLGAVGGISGAFTDVALPVNYVLSGVSYEDDVATVAFRSQIGAGLNVAPINAGAAAYLDALSLSSDESSTRSLLQSVLATDDSAQMNAVLRDFSGEAFSGSDLIMTETALSVTNSVRSSTRGVALEKGQFQAWAGAGIADTDFDGEVVTDSELETHSGLIGFTYGVSDSVSLGAFAGALTFEQRFAALGSVSEGDGFVGGATMDFKRDSAQISAIVAFANATSELNRVLSSGATSYSEADLSSTIASIEARYHFGLADMLTLSPFGGFTYASSDREEIEETGVGDRALAVDEHANGYIFAEGGLALSVSAPIAGRISPFLEAGGRYEVMGDDSFARVRLINEDQFYIARGLDVERSRLFVNAGVTINIADGIDFTAAYRGRAGDDLASHGGNAAVSVRF